MEQFEFHEYADHPTTGAARAWTELEPGISQLTLNHNDSSGRRTVLQRWQPRTANVQQNFVHDYVEEIFIVEGDLADTKRGGGPVSPFSQSLIWQRCESGAFSPSPPFSPHLVRAG